MHVHVQRERMVCKFWIESLALAENHGFAPQELNQIRNVIQALGHAIRHLCACPQSITCKGPN
ncbi:MAG TPA: DUF4160 domain-containing protein [Terriglobia bacterium]|nr:DUF4160 domain-containing protein [Terriglobia bacterium]